MTTDWTKDPLWVDVMNLVKRYVYAPPDQNRLLTFIHDGELPDSEWDGRLELVDEIKVSIEYLRKRETLVIDRDQAAIDKALLDLEGSKNRPWVAISSWKYDELMNNVPPVIMLSDGFVMGEPQTLLDDWKTNVWLTGRIVDGGTCIRYSTLSEFRKCRYEDVLPPVRTIKEKHRG